MKMLLKWAKAAKENLQETHKMDLEEGLENYSKKDVDLIYDEFIIMVEARLEGVEIVFKEKPKAAKR